jgi:ankyrin repeat protein
VPRLPANPNIDQLRHQARDLVEAARRGDADARARIAAVSSELTLAAAQLAIAREYGFASWARMKQDVDSRTLELAERVDAFSEAIVGTRPGRAARILSETPEIADYNFATAVLLGDAGRVATFLKRDPNLATRRDPRTGWTALHAACASRLYQLDPALGEGLVAVARLLIDAGADPLKPSPRWTPLGCAIAATNSGPANLPIIELLLGHGARPADEDIYLAGFAHDRHELLRLLLPHVSDPAELRHAFASPIDNNDAESLRLLLAAGADPQAYVDDNGDSVPTLWAAAVRGCSSELVELLIVHGADLNRAGPDGRSPYRHATVAGRADLLELLRRHHAVEDATDAERFLWACVHGEREHARALLDAKPSLLVELEPQERAMLVRAAESANTEAVSVMLDLGLPIDVRGDRGETALHAAAHAGSPDTVQLLLTRGADIEARDTTWNDTPLGWAEVGSGERPTTTTQPDWLETVRILLAHGASRDATTIDLDGPKPPSADVAELLRLHLETRDD